MSRAIWPFLLAFGASFAVLLPLMLTFDEARPWIALAGVICGASIYAIGRVQRR